MTQRGCSYDGSAQYTRTSENPARASRRFNPRTRWAPPSPLAARPHQRGLARPTYRQPPGRRILRHSSRRVAPAYPSSRVTQSNVPSRYGSVRGVAQAGATLAYPCAVSLVHSRPSVLRSKPRTWTLLKCSARPAICGAPSRPRSSARSQREISASQSQLVRAPSFHGGSPLVAASSCARPPASPSKPTIPETLSLMTAVGCKRYAVPGNFVERVVQFPLLQGLQGVMLSPGSAVPSRFVAAQQHQVAPGHLRHPRRLRGLPAGGLPRGRALAPRDPEGRVEGGQVAHHEVRGHGDHLRQPPALGPKPRHRGAQRRETGEPQGPAGPRSDPREARQRA